MKNSEMYFTKIKLHYFIKINDFNTYQHKKLAPFLYFFFKYNSTYNIKL